MKLLLIGQCGETHAFAQALAKSRNIELFSLMEKKNKGIASLSVDYEIGDISDLGAIDYFANHHDIDMIVIIPEKPLLKGAANFFNEKGIPCIGASALCAWLEADKGFLRTLMKDNNIDAYPSYKIFYEKGDAIKYLRQTNHPVVVKPAGITTGQGVKIMGVQLENIQQAIEYVSEIFDNEIGNMACAIIEEKLEGEEFTMQIISDGRSVVPFPVVKNYVYEFDGNTGLITPGMGSCSQQDLPFLEQHHINDALNIVKRILTALREQYSEFYFGFLSAQFMMTKNGLKLIEIDVRPGDPEILNVLPLLKNDFGEVLIAIANSKLHEIEIEFEKKASVCKYLVPNGFSSFLGNIEVHIDRKKLAELDVNLFQSCFDVGENLFEPGPRLFAISATADTLQEANEKCHQGLSCIKANKVYYRKDIGTPAMFA
jgi:phosphoribosylamine---glycine ligase